MKTRAVRLYGAKDLRLEEFELPPVKEGEILIRIVSDSVCMSTYKTAVQGAAHIRVPNDVAEHPAIIGHEFCAEVAQVGSRWKDAYQPGDKVVIPPVLSYLGTMDTIGYSFGEIGGDATYALVYEHIIENGYLMKITSDAFFRGSLVEPVSCVVRGFKETFHLHPDGGHVTGLKEGGKVALLASCGPMGLEAIDWALHSEYRPSMVVVCDLDQQRLDHAKQIFDPAEAEKRGIQLVFTPEANAEALREISGRTGYDDVFVYIANRNVVELADAILGFDGCLNFFSGPTDKSFSVPLNFYNVHYAQHHVAGTSGSTTEDMRDVVEAISAGRIDPAVMITHIGGLDAVIDTTLRFPEIPGGKKLIYTHINLPLTALKDFGRLGRSDRRFRELDQMVEENCGLWSPEAERYLLEHF